ncbi:hypothetical protein HK405_008756, partial [Cladochytrium tenue]
SMTGSSTRTSPPTAGLAPSDVKGMIPAGLANRYLARRALVVVFMNSYLKKYGPPPVHHAPPRGSIAITLSASSLAMASAAAASRSPSLNYARPGQCATPYNPAAAARPPPLPPSIATDSVALSPLPNIPDYSPSPSSSASNPFYLSQSPPAVFMNPMTSTAAATTASSSVASWPAVQYLDWPVAPEPRASFAFSFVYRRRSSPTSPAAKSEPAASRPSFEHVDRRSLTAASSTDGPPSPSPNHTPAPNVAAATGWVQLADAIPRTPGTSATTTAEAALSPRPATLPRAAPRPHRHSAAQAAADDFSAIAAALDYRWRQAGLQIANTGGKKKEAVDPAKSDSVPTIETALFDALTHACLVQDGDTASGEHTATAVGGMLANARIKDRLIRPADAFAKEEWYALWKRLTSEQGYTDNVTSKFRWKRSAVQKWYLRALDLQPRAEEAALTAGPRPAAAAAKDAATASAASTVIAAGAGSAPAPVAAGDTTVPKASAAETAAVQMDARDARDVRQAEIDAAKTCCDVTE